MSGIIMYDTDTDELKDMAIKDKPQMKAYSDAIFELKRVRGDYLNVKYGNKRIGDLSLEEWNDMECEALINAL
jgi:hypothetical protein